MTPAQPEPLLEPVAPVNGYFWPHRAVDLTVSADRVAVPRGQFTEETLPSPQMRRAGKPGESDDADASSADARLEFGDQPLIAKTRVPGKKAFSARRSGHSGPSHAARQMRKQGRHIERGGVLQHRTDSVSSNSRSFCLNQLSSGCQWVCFGAPGEEHAGDPRRVFAGGRYVYRQNASGLEVLTFGGVLNLALSVERRADRIGKRST